MLQGGNFVVAADQFNEKVAAQIDAVKIESIWNTLNTQAGKFQKIESIQTEKKGDFIITVSLCKFDKTFLNIQLAFDEENKVSGLFFKSATPPAVAKYQLPAYAKKENYETVNMQLESPAGPLKAVYTKPIGVEAPPAIVLIHGSGPNDEDETLGPNKLFVDLASGLATKGIATFRYVKRVKAYPGSFGENATIDDEVLVDAINAIDKVSILTKGKVVVLGHSLGGMMTPEIVTLSKKVKGGIIFAGNSRPLEELMIEQVDYIMKNDGANGQQASYEMIKKAAIKLKSRNFDENTPKAELLNIGAVYWNDLLEYNQVKTAKKAKTPFLIMQGERDYQVTMKDFEGWKKALGKKGEFISYSNLNHMFLEGEGICLPEEYNQPGNVPEYVIDDIAKWVNSLR